MYSVQKNSHPFSCLIGYTVRFPLIHHPRVPVCLFYVCQFLLGHYEGGGRGGGREITGKDLLLFSVQYMYTIGVYVNV
jgi:hypothetical protein